MLHLTAPSPPSVPATRPHPLPLIPKPLRQCPLLPPSHRLSVPLQFHSNIIEARRLLLNSHSTLLFPLPLNSSSPPLHRNLFPLSKAFLPPPTRVRCLHPAKLLLHQCLSHSSPSSQPSHPSPQHLHLSASLLSSQALHPLPRAPSHLEHPCLPHNLGLFLLPGPLQLQLLLPSTQVPCHPNSSPLQLSHPHITQDHLLLEVRCLLRLWPRPTICLPGLLGLFSSLHLSLAFREVTLPSRMVHLGR